MNDPWMGCNPLDPTFREDPYPLLRHLREVDPVNLTPAGFWRLTRYADVIHLLEEVPNGVRPTDGSFPPGAVLADGAFGLFMLQQDPPNHTRLRKLVSKAFTPRALESLRPKVQAITDHLLDGVAEKGTMDVIADLALPVPSTVICEMMGVPTTDRATFTEWTAHATHLLAAMLIGPEVVERGIAASASLAAYFQDLIDDRRKHLSDDILSNLIRAEEAGDRLSTAELLSQSIGLLIAGFETTIGLIGNGVLQLIRHPDQLEKLRQKPALIASAVEECLRFDGPIALTSRYLHADAEFGGKLLPKDTLMWAMLFAANRDPAQFPEPDRFDIERHPNEHVAFGGGPHFCLGAFLARMEGQIAIGSLVRRFRDFELLSHKLEWGKSLFRVLGRLPIRVRPV